MTVRAGVIGVGYLGRHHARILSGLDGARLEAVADTDIGLARGIAGQYGCAAYADYREMLDKVDAVTVVTPTVTHHGVSMECLRAGKDLLIEKPIAETVEQADALIAEAKRRGSVLQVGHLERFNPALIETMKFLDEVEFIEAERMSPMQGRGLDVDVTLDLMIHDIDIVMGLLGGARVRDMRVVGARVLTERLDVAKAWIEFDTGVAALITASRIAREKVRTLKLYQRRSFVELDYIGMTVKRHFRGNGTIESETVDVAPREPLRDELADFIQCVRMRRAPRVSGLDGRNALEVALAITNKIKEMDR